MLSIFMVGGPLPDLATAPSRIARRPATCNSDTRTMLVGCSALPAYKEAGHTTGIGPKANGWIKKPLKKVGDVGFKVATTVA
jgi:hypothetical protein